MELADRMQRLPTQFFASLVQRVNARMAAGHDVINLGQGNPDLPTPPHVVAALCEAAHDARTHRYPPFTGLPRLKQAAAQFYQRQYGVTLDPETEIAILFGGKAGLVEISQIVLNAGDLALVPDPGYPDYCSGIALAGARMETVALRADNGFLPDLEAVPEAQLQAAKLAFFNYPNNPTAVLAPPAFFSELAAWGLRNEILICHDFAYGAISFDGRRPQSFLAAAQGKAAGIEIYTLSKTYNMAGWRIAFAAGRADVIAAINLYQDHCYVSLFAAVQLAAAAALDGSQACVSELCATYQRRRDAFVGELSAMDVDSGQPPLCRSSQGTFYVWMRNPRGIKSAAFADFLLERADVAVAPGIGFGPGGDDYVRIGLLTSEERLREAAVRIRRALAGRPL